MLTSLGIGPDEEQVYRALVLRPSATVADLAAATYLAEADVAAALRLLRERGLASADGTEHLAAPPAVALGQLVRDRRDELRQAELDLILLAEAHRLAGDGRRASDVVEVITGVDGVRHRFFQIHQAARHEFRAFVRPNPAVVEAADHAEEEHALHRGVRYRVVLDRAVLSGPGMAQRATDTIAAGEEIRIADSLPLKMLIADNDLALLPLAPDSGGAAAILVHASGLLEALVALFEGVWERAYPLRTSPTGDDVIGRPAEVEELDTRILALLLAGLTDQAVAGQLDVSLRTVQRRVHALMEIAGVQTRIQLGWAAARRDWA
ncbi:helix-turn-helix domain-containing protein [Allocatelliglobosispora scoriae]|uniref:helix-turn-helix domain-containing protein n=1 Tax=Allocatelliglobosispora scoriae TaxID=643052 RepID=UPI0016105610|nr:helix-turn-helix domain-containing protein [Allocatelliglobosispora scoriae]